MNTFDGDWNDPQITHRYLIHYQFDGGWGRTFLGRSGPLDTKGEIEALEVTLAASPEVPASRVSIINIIPLKG